MRWSGKAERKRDEVSVFGGNEEDKREKGHEE